LIKFGIHTIDSITVSEYGIINRTENLSLLRLWWNKLPIKWFDTKSFFEEFRTVFASTENPSLKESYRIISYNNIIILDQILKTLSILMKNHNERSLFSMLLGVKKKEYKGNFDFYVNKVSNLTGIEIKDGKDLKRLQNEIERLWDSYQNKYKPKEDDKEKTLFIVDAMTIFEIMEMSFVPNMKLSELAALKIKADNKLIQIQKQNDKNRNT